MRNPPDNEFFFLQYREPLREASHWLLIIGLGFFLADAATATLEERLAVPPVPLPPTVVAALAPGPGTAAPPDMTRLLATTEPPAVATIVAPPTGAATPPAQSLEASVPVTLIGNMVGANGAGLALLMVGGESLAAATGQPVLDWTVKEVLPTSIVLERNGSVRALELDQPADLATATQPTTIQPATAPVAPSTPPPTTPAADPTASPTPAASVEPITTQREIRDLLDNHMPDFIKQGSIKPVVREGQVIGYGIKVKDPAFPLARIGLLTGDIVKSVNGTPCTGPGDVGKLLGILRNSSSLSFEVERGGTAITHKVNLEP